MRSKLMSTILAVSLLLLVTRIGRLHILSKISNNLDPVHIFLPLRTPFHLQNVDEAFERISNQLKSSFGQFQSNPENNLTNPESI